MRAGRSIRIHRIERKPLPIAVSRPPFNDFRRRVWNPAVDGDANSGPMVCEHPLHQRERHQGVAVPYQTVARELLARHVERARIVGIVKGL
jgi:hypothetical protein